MTSDEPKRITTALRVKVRYPDIDTFVERFAVNVGRSGLFIPTPAPKPVGSEVRFEVRLADDRAVLIGQGLVRWVREPLPERSRATTGMAIELQRVSRESRDVLVRMLAVRKRRGMVDGPGGLPVIEDEPADGDEEERASASRSMRRLTTPPPGEPAPAPAPAPAPEAALVAEAALA
ncbi:MAG TPA: PilZ domain-containing protein, partial [Kofleriaceae bacterium]|nr:PilZ domain-containing protein [Kofleriaceae bacterium]